MIRSCSSKARSSVSGSSNSKPLDRRGGYIRPIELGWLANKLLTPKARSIRGGIADRVADRASLPAEPKMGLPAVLPMKVPGRQFSRKNRSLPVITPTSSKCKRDSDLMGLLPTRRGPNIWAKADGVGKNSSPVPKRRVQKATRKVRARLPALPRKVEHPFKSGIVSL